MAGGGKERGKAQKANERQKPGQAGSGPREGTGAAGPRAGCRARGAGCQGPIFKIGENVKLPSCRVRRLFF